MRLVHRESFVAAVLTGMLVAVVLSLLTACYLAKPVTQAKMWPTGTPSTAAVDWYWCFAGQLDAERNFEGGLLCMDSQASCEEAREKALQFGGYGHIETVGHECVQVSVKTDLTAP